MTTARGLAGSVTPASGQTAAFAAYVNHVSLPPDPESAQTVAGQALGEIAAAAYDAPLDAPSAAANYDMLIRNGHVIDGTGNPWYAADVAINGDRIERSVVGCGGNFSQGLAGDGLRRRLAR